MYNFHIKKKLTMMLRTQLISPPSSLFCYISANNFSNVLILLANGRDAIQSINQESTGTISNSVLIAIDVVLQDEKFIIEGDDKVPLSFSVHAKEHQLVSAQSVEFNPEFDPDRKPIVWMNLTSYFLVPREALPGLVLISS